jgi:hypothetical protein
LRYKALLTSSHLYLHCRAPRGCSPDLDPMRKMRSLPRANGQWRGGSGTLIGSHPVLDPHSNEFCCAFTIAYMPCARNAATSVIASRNTLNAAGA